MTPEGNMSGDSEKTKAAHDLAPLAQSQSGLSHGHKRFLTASSRLARIMSLWFDDKSYWKIVASGRFLKLSQATHWASENLETAARRGRNANDGAQAAQPSAQVAPRERPAHDPKAE